MQPRMCVIISHADLIFQSAQIAAVIRGGLPVS
jgi:hypothetical protein